MDSSSIFEPNFKLADELLEATCKRLNFDVNKVKETPNTQGFIVSLVFSLTKRPIENTYLAAAITMWEHYRTCPTNIADYANVFKKHLRPDVYDFLITNADRLQPHLNFEADFDNLYFSVGTLLETYLARLSYDESPLEIPQMALLRVAARQFCRIRRNLHGVTVSDPVESVLEKYTEDILRGKLVPPVQHFSMKVLWMGLQFPV